MTFNLQKLQQIKYLGHGQHLDAAQRAALQKQKLEVACQGFESMFWHLMLKGMRRSVIKANWLDGGLKQRFAEDMLDQVMADRMAGSGQVGLAKMLIKQIEGVKRYRKPPALAKKDLRPLEGGRRLHRAADQ
ncbi:MAG: rod-binding protein [Proteobacteria bacterium]|nr:rod-binding protein [Pseudomonadota bacterium]MBU1742232.1 rod-binding protein [Pseudomonadota bacterium]